MATQFSNKSVKIWSENLTQSFFIKLNPIKTRISSMIQMNQFLLIATCDPNIQVFDMTNQNETTTKIVQINECVKVLNVIDFEQDKYLISANNKTLQIWNSDLLNIAELTTQHQDKITSLAFNSNSSLLASGAADQSIIIWNVASYQSSRQAFMENCSSCHVQSLTLLSNGNIVSGSYDGHMPNGNLFVWNQSSLSLIKVLNNSYDYAMSLVTLSKNDMFAVGYGNYQIEIYDSTSLELLATLNETGSVLALAMLPNGNIVSASTSSSDFRIKIWNVNSNFNLIGDWDAHNAAILCLAILPNNGNIISGSQDNTIKIWDQENFTLIKEIKVFETVFSLAVLADGNLAAGILSTLSFWNMTSFKLIKNLDSHTDIIYALSLMFDATLLSGSNDGTIKIWKNYELINTLNALSPISCVLALNNFKFLIGVNNNTIQEWEKNSNISNIYSLATLNGHTDTILTLSFLDNTYYMASGSKDSTIKIWDLLNLRLYKTLIGHLNAVTALINLPNMKFASGSRDKTILIWDIEQSFRNNYNLTSHLGGINSLAYLNRKKQLVSSSQDVTSIIWNVNNDLILKYELINNSLAVQDVTELDNGNLLSCSDDLTVSNWNYVSNSSFSFKTNHNDYIFAILFVNNNLIATGSKDLTIKIWNQSFYLVSTLYGHLKPVVALLALPATTTLLASGSCDTTIKIWNLNTFSLITTLVRHKGCVNTLALYGTEIMLSGSSDKQIIVWNITNNNFEIITYLIGHKDAINSIDTYKTRLIAAGSQDATIKIWSSAHRVTQMLTNHTDSVFGLVVLKNGNLASGSIDNTIKIWDKNTRELLYTLSNHTGNVFKLAVLNNGFLISGSWDWRIIVWNNTNIVKIITDHTDQITGLFVLKNGNFVSCSVDYTIRLWDANTFEMLAMQVYNFGVYQPFSLTGLQNDTGIAYGDKSGSIYIL